MHLRLLSWSFRHRRWRHLLDVVTMAITASVVMLFVSVMVDLVAYMNQNRDRELTRILIFPKMVAGELPMSLYPVLQSVDGARVVQRYRHLSGRHESGATYLVIGEEDSGVELNQDFFPVEPAVIEAWKKERPLGAIVTEATARDLRLQVGQLAEVPTTAGPLKLKIVGISRGGTIGQRIAGHFEYFQEFVGNPGTCRFRVFSKPEDYERVASAIVEKTKNSASPVQAVSASQFAASWARQAGTVPAVLGFLGLFLIFTTSLTIANSSAIAIRQRRTEIATMRVLGYHQGTIARLMMSEAVLVGLIGGVVAVAITLIVFRDGVQLTPGSSQLLKPVKVGIPGIAAGLAMSVLVPLAGVLPSAIGSVRKKLVEALRDA
jgi:ABC-type lipoprotein release transport system permease subunit